MKHLFSILLTVLVTTAASSTWASSTTYYARLTFGITFTSSGGGSYTVNDAAPKNMLY